MAQWVKSPPAMQEMQADVSSLPRSGKSPSGGHSNPLQYSCLENSMDREAWWATLYRVAKSCSQLKRLCTHAEVGGFPCGSDGKESACNARDLGSIPGGKITWRREWQPQYTCLGCPMDRRSLAGYSPWSRKSQT